MWPTQLPDFETSGYQDAEKDIVLRSPVGYGPDKVRVRSTLAIRQVAGQILVDSITMPILDAFYSANKAIIFDKNDVRTNTIVNYRFISPPVYSHLGGDEYIASFGLEQIGA